jgi:transcriptional regulator with XRE-family HTH domain
VPAYRFSGSKLRSAREAAGYTREELALRIDRSASLLTLLELDYKQPTAPKLVELAFELDVPVEYFFVADDEVPA